MRLRTATLLAIGLACANAGSVTARSPSASPAPADQRVELPGYGVSIIVPAHWTTELYGATGFSLYPESQLQADLTVAVTGGPEAQWCQLAAASPATCDAPVDLSAELAAPGWDGVPLAAGEAAYRAFDEPYISCSQYLLSDGLDMYSLQCCGADRAADDWRSIADTFAFPQQSRWDSPDAVGRDLLEEVEVVWQMPSIRPQGWSSGEGSRWPVGQRLIGWHRYESDTGEVLLATDEIRDPGAATEVVLDGLLAWVADVRDHRYEDPPVLEEMDMGGREVQAVTFGTDDPTEYILASGDTAIRVWGSDEEAAVTMLEALSCRHVDSNSLVREDLQERKRQRSSGADE